MLAADGLYKRDLLSESSTPLPPPPLARVQEHTADSTASLGFPDPFAVVTVDGEQTHTTSVIRKTLNPYWNESFDMYEHPPLA